MSSRGFNRRVLMISTFLSPIARSPDRPFPDRPFPDRPIAHFPIAHSPKIAHFPQNRPLPKRSPARSHNRMKPPTTPQGQTPHRAVSLPQKFIAHCSQTSPKSPIPSKRRKCTRPESPATTVTPSGAKAQQKNQSSPVKLATS